MQLIKVYEGTVPVPFVLSAVDLGDSTEYSWQYTYSAAPVAQGTAVVDESNDGSGWTPITATPVVTAAGATTLANTYVPITASKSAYTRMVVTGATPTAPTDKVTVTICIKQPYKY
jgi:hypothetical protein